jgi:DNA-binding CsgD family transcriptional regulator/tetratricopeptide (TPR) repeat protein
MRRARLHTHLDIDASVSADAPERLYGRERELNLLDRVLEVAHGGKSFVVRGDAGIGKSALLAELSHRAAQRGFRTVMATGVGLETDLPFAGLHALLTPALDRLDRLPGRLRAAISAAFGLNGDSAPDRFLIALAALELLTEMAADAPVLVIVEDAQWLDTPSADVLAFLSRRLGAEPVATVFAVRDGIASRFDQLGVSELRVDPLSAEDAGALLDAVAPDLAVNVRAQVLEAAAGNPLALIELPRAIRDDDREGRLVRGPLRLTERLQHTFNTRADELPRQAQTLLLVAALNDSGAVNEIVAAARLLADDVGEEHLAAAVVVGLLRLHGMEIEFRHPLVRSAVYEAATTEQRRTASAALAQMLASDPDRSVWHRAAAAEGPDEEVVQMLEATAERARRRGAAATAVAAFERAARLTAAEASQGAYLIRAANVALSLGRPNVVLRLLREAAPLDLEPADRTWLLWHLEQFEPRWTGATKVPALVEMAKRLSRGGDDLRALQVLDDVAFRCWWGNPRPQTGKLVVDAAESLELPPSTPAVLSVLGLADPVGQGARVVEQLSRSLSGPDRDPWEAQELGVAGAAVWADDIALQFLTAAASGARAQGRLGLLAQVLVSQAWAAVNLGQWETASTSAAEAASLAGETSQLRWIVVARLAEGVVAASRGDAAAAEEILEECEQPLLAYGANPLLALVQLLRGRFLLAAGRHTDAYDELRRIFEPTEPAYQLFAGVWSVVDLAEAAAQAGRATEARALLEPLEGFAAHSTGALLHASLRFARAVLADADEVEGRLADAVAADFSSWPFTRARLLLAQGAWLRRHGQVAASRAPLRAARAGFHGLGAVPWSERAAQELRASGEAPRPRRVDLRRELTAQELQIARMAADGQTNREIGQRLFLSHRTIATHLYRVYPKLGVTSRGQLRRALDASEEEPERRVI